MSHPRPQHHEAHQGVALLAVVEAALQRAVRLSASARAACVRLEGTMVALCCEDLNCTILLCASPQGIRLLLRDNENRHPPGLRLMGTVPAILASLLGWDMPPQARWSGDAQAMQDMRCLAQAAARQGLGWPLHLDGVLGHGLALMTGRCRGMGLHLLRQMAEAASWEWGWCATPTQATVCSQRLAILEQQLQDMRTANPGVAESA